MWRGQHGGRKEIHPCCVPRTHLNSLPDQSVSVPWAGDWGRWQPQVLSSLGLFSSLVHSSRESDLSQLVSHQPLVSTWPQVLRFGDRIEEGSNLARCTDSSSLFSKCHFSSLHRVLHSWRTQSVSEPGCNMPFGTGAVFKDQGLYVWFQIQVHSLTCS